MLKVGDRVKLAQEAWERWTDFGILASESNPLDVDGTVVEVNEYDKFRYRVEWDNGTFNSYHNGDLEPLAVEKAQGFKVGDVVLVIGNAYKSHIDHKDVGRKGSLGYVTAVEPHGVQVARWSDYDPDAHDENSLFFLNDEVVKLVSHI